MRSWALALGLLLAVPTGAGLAHLTTPTTCTVVDVTDVPLPVVERMRHDGWVADPTDGREALTFCEVTR